MSSVQERLDRMINGTGTASSGAGSSVMERLDRMTWQKPKMKRLRRECCLMMNCRIYGLTQ